MDTLAALELSENYRRTTRAMATDRRLSPLYRSNTMRGAFRDAWPRLSVVARGQVLFDYVNVLRNTWDETEAQSLRVTPDLLRSLDELLTETPWDDADPDLIEELRKKIGETRGDLRSSFLDFKRTEEPRSFESIEQYDEWFNRNCPYLVMDIPLDNDQAADREVNARIRFFLDKLPPDVGLDETYLERAWRYVQSAYEVLRREKQPTV